PPHVKASGELTPNTYEPEFHGMMPLTDAPARSVNTATVRLSQAVGLDAVRQVSADFGLQSELAQGPAIVLGSSGATLLDMTGAYAGILNGGSSVHPYGLQELDRK